MDQGRKRLKTKQTLRKQEISDELSDMPSDIFSDSGDEKKKERKNFGHRK
jgi:hypothetical protein